jgi:hypothetical protein
MDAAGITKFAGFLGEKIQPSPRQGWLSICCPLGWRHAKGHDSQPGRRPAMAREDGFAAGLRRSGLQLCSLEVILHFS